MSNKDQKKNKKEAKRRQKQAPSSKRNEEGLYLDFEGYGGRFKPDPILCGYRVGGSGPFRQVVFTAAYKAAAVSLDPGYPVEYCADRAGFLEKLLSEDCAGRRLFVFGRHERDVIKKLLGISVKKRLKDVHKIAKEAFPQVKKPRQLIKYCETAGIDVPVDYGKGEVTKKFTRVGEWSGTDTKWRKAPDEVKRAWRLILDHNRFDVECMYELMKRIKEKTF